MGRKKKVEEKAPIELEVMPVHEVVKRQFIVTAFSALPADYLKDEPDIRVEVEAASACAASVAMMRQFRRPSYFYVKVVDVTPPKARRRHSVEDAGCGEEDQPSEELL